MFGPDEVKVVPKKFTGKYANMTAGSYDKYGEIRKDRDKPAAAAKSSYKFKKGASVPLDIKEEV